MVFCYDVGYCLSVISFIRAPTSYDAYGQHHVRSFLEDHSHQPGLVWTNKLTGVLSNKRGVEECHLLLFKAARPPEGHQAKCEI
jgi:hypothetical protein